MAKTHTHYDNLKVSRMAPQEVIRAAYKALSQKYHPDKNPGDEKAARIMAILNSAYETLSDPQRRKEHDEWIASEEWEIEWLESTRHEDGHHRPDKGKHDSGWHPEHVHESPLRRGRRRDWRVWAGLAACLALGWVGGMTMVAEPQMMSNLLSSAWGGKGGINANAATADSAPAHSELRDLRAEAKAEQRDAWASVRLSESHNYKASPIRVAAMSQVVLPGAGAECDTENQTQTLVAPNGEPWPTKSGYMEGFPVGNRGDEMQLTLDNSGNGSAVFIKVYDMDRRSNVRYAYVQAHDKLLVDKLANGKYEIRYQNLDVSANPGACGATSSRTAVAGAEAGASPVNN
ncbi:DnaJ domain-containing protein [Duganella sp. FT80W]|uniref:DnaJ domain-containing protein n=1 Tax=Duganella guangzhouensis TaxID=2666084 RepID=A0A6I2L3Y0_9BURK|nr:J domain-containing protein [Duganella guangzhouensis]MRW90949.1 DnaJ domain-containing protein [Duganella guangzhouensis]